VTHAGAGGPFDDRWLSTLAVAAQWQWLRPSDCPGRQGFSAFAKAAIRDLGEWHAVLLIRQRFSACRDAAEELREKRAKREKDG